MKLQPGERIETRAVLAAAYRGRGAGLKFLLTHAAVVSSTGQAQRTLCRTVKPDSLADRGAHDPEAVPICLRCVARLARVRRA